METIYWLQQFASPTLDSVALAITNLGSEPAYIAILLVVYLGIDPRIGQRVGIILLCSLYLNFHLKGIFATPRPFELDPGVARSAAAVETGMGWGFPSGHAQGSATLWGALALYLGRVWFWVIAVLLAVTIALTRIYLGVHVPIDVIAGLAVAVVAIAVGYGIDRWLSAARVSPLWLVVVLGIGAPYALHMLLPVPESEVMMGALAAFITGPLLVPYQGDRPLWVRVSVVLLGVLLTFGVLVGSSLLLPEELKRNATGGFVRYLVIGYTGLALTPWLSQVVHLTPAPERAAL
ncbi:MAG: phosphatase PAP2 family protein [Trueperaceae bacterium]|nr:phosphatase PAP2 family protein [Trueperaceae bacterium]